jgi:uncharacterized protein YjbI with pentapeptide repeats
MNIDEFKRILTTFTDNPADMNLSKGKLLAQIRDDIIEADIYIKNGSLYINESETEYTAYKWLIQRIARLPQLADRIISFIPNEPNFITSTGDLIDQLEINPNEEQKKISNVVDCTREVLSRRPAGTSSVLYLTSDAGEGKTTIINKIARVQALEYKNKATDWLLVPIPLGGRPFLRFDDVVIGALVNKLRFQFLYYDAFIELVKLGAIVPAFDGFEEMFVDRSTGEALSALGNLMNALQSSGSVLISARKAYFEYKSFATQAKLFDALEINSVAFSRLALNRWNREQFLQYCDKRDIHNGDTIFEDFSIRLDDPQHPLLTRAVLVKRLLDIANYTDGKELLLSKLGNAPHDYFFEFVNAIIEREAHEKWLDRSGSSLASPLISVSEHHDLLSLIAEEMWLVNSENLRDDALELIAELFSEVHKKTPSITGQIKERIKQHALITSSNSNNTLFAFDHEEFRYFFLGQSIGRRISENNPSSLRNLLHSGALPKQVFSSAAQFLRYKNYNMSKAIELLQNISKADTITSFTRENCGGLIIRLLNTKEGDNISINKVTFPSESLRGRTIKGINFSDCYFQTTSLTKANIYKCEFNNCRFDNLELSNELIINNTVLSSCEIISIIPALQDNSVFDPLAINQTLSNIGFRIENPRGEIPLSNKTTEPDEALQLTERVLRYFQRSTQINENIFRLKLGIKSSTFLSEVLPQLIRTGVVNEIKFSGGGSQNRYRLGVAMHSIDEAISQSNGSFDRFLILVSPESHKG